MPAVIPRLQRKPRLGARLDRQHPLSRGLVGCWLFNEGGGNKLWDISGNGNHGTLINMDPSSDWVASPKGSALDFDNTDDYVDLGDPVVAAFGTGDFSAEIWVFPTGTVNFERFFGYWTIGGTLGWAIEDNGALDWIDFVTSSNVRARSQIFTRSRWHHVGCTRRGSTLSIYVDGVKGADATALDDVDPGTKLSVGAYSYPWSGRIAKCGIYNRALSASEIRWLYVEPYANVVTPVYRRYFVAGASFQPAWAANASHVIGVPNA
jgi:hypothetical protein